MTAFLIFFFFLLSTFLDFSSWIWFLGLTPRKLLQFFAPQWHFFFSFPVWKVKTQQFMIWHHRHSCLQVQGSECHKHTVVECLGFWIGPLAGHVGLHQTTFHSPPLTPNGPPSPFCWSQLCKRCLSGTHGWVVEIYQLWRCYIIMDLTGFNKGFCIFFPL